MIRSLFGVIFLRIMWKETSPSDLLFIINERSIYSALQIRKSHLKWFGNNQQNYQKNSSVQLSVDIKGFKLHLDFSEILQDGCDIDAFCHIATCPSIYF